MAFCLKEDNVDCLFYETDAQPIVKNDEEKKTHLSSEKKVVTEDSMKKCELSDDSDNDIGSIDCDRLVKSAMPLDTSQFKVENSAVEVVNSSSVRIGNSFNQKTDITFERATSVVVDRRQWNYINCPDSAKVYFIRNY